ncbi:DUF4330 domain-containing protein [filamentous cyanobacterium LEGE 11480]|uniref:DUF4330 domain-containing protein n=1 Tax=Romeriopsis navalis LEGE 11480 TaxID=2777977 RepID=A0A928Z2L4_9CYAN|nr:DUF4330 domain-containing protein [Romeriopsis navalis]MBE9029177.1 DUF4330 domain-containing protein [Romeriopsis navalis LEGE 11480]
MAIVDAQGRLFGKVSLLDVGAGAIIAMVVGGIFLLPGKTGSAVGGDNGKEVEVDVIVLGMKSAQDVSQLLKTGDSIDVIIRNEPAGSVNIDKLTVLPRDVLVPQPDGTVKALPDPRPQAKYFTSFLMTLKGNAKVADDGVVFGNKKVKIGTTLELESKEYNFRSSVLQVRQ